MKIFFEHLCKKRQLVATLLIVLSVFALGQVDHALAHECTICHGRTAMQCISTGKLANCSTTQVCLKSITFISSTPTPTSSSDKTDSTGNNFNNTFLIESKCVGHGDIIAVRTLSNEYSYQTDYKYSNSSSQLELKEEEQQYDKDKTILCDEIDINKTRCAYVCENNQCGHSLNFRGFLINVKMVLTFVCSNRLGNIYQYASKDSPQYVNLETSIEQALLNLVYKNNDSAWTAGTYIFLHHIQPLEYNHTGSSSVKTNYDTTTQIYQEITKDSYKNPTNNARFSEYFTASVIIDSDVLASPVQTPSDIHTTLMHMLLSPHILKETLHGLINVSFPITIQPSSQIQCPSQTITATVTTTGQTFILVTWPHVYVSGTKVTILCPTVQNSTKINNDDNKTDENTNLSSFRRRCHENGTWSHEIEDHVCLENILSTHFASSFHSYFPSYYSSHPSPLPLQFEPQNISFKPYGSNNPRTTHSLLPSHNNNNEMEDSRFRNRKRRAAPVSQLAVMSRKVIDTTNNKYFSEPPERAELYDWIDSMHEETTRSGFSWPQSLAHVVIHAMESILRHIERYDNERFGSRQSKQITDILKYIPAAGWNFHMQTDDALIGCKQVNPDTDHIIRVAGNQMTVDQHDIVGSTIKMLSNYSDDDLLVGQDDIAVLIPPQVSYLAIEQNSSLKIHTHTTNIVYPCFRHNVQSWVAALDVDNSNITELDNNETIIVTFGKKAHRADVNMRVSNIHCVRWGESPWSPYHKERWVSDGAQLVESNDDYTKCAFTHITAYALSLQIGWPPHIQVETEYTPKILLFISCLSTSGMFIVLVILITQAVFTRQKILGILRIWLIIAYLLKNAVFSARMLKYVFHDDRSCLSVFDPLLAYALISSQFWIYLTSVTMLLRQQKCWNYKSSMLISLAIGWIVPALYVMMVEYYYNTRFSDYLSEQDNTLLHTLRELLCWKSVAWYKAIGAIYTAITLLVELVAWALRFGVDFLKRLYTLVEVIILSVCFFMAVNREPLVFAIFNLLLTLYTLVPLIKNMLGKRALRLEKEKARLLSPTEVDTWSKSTAETKSTVLSGIRKYKTKVGSTAVDPKRGNGSNSIGSGF